MIITNKILAGRNVTSIILKQTFNENDQRWSTTLLVVVSSRIYRTNASTEIWRQLHPCIFHISSWRSFAVTSSAPGENRI